MPYQNPDPGYIPRLHQILETLQAEIAQREEATTALARQNTELYGELRRRLAESESFDRVLSELAPKNGPGTGVGHRLHRGPGLTRGDRQTRSCC